MHGIELHVARCVGFVVVGFVVVGFASFIRLVHRYIYPFKGEKGRDGIGILPPW